MSTRDEEIVFSLRDRRYVRVALAHELRRPRLLPFERRDGRWELRVPRPPADRLEYLLEVERRGGVVERIPDPGNPARVRGVFGEKSVLELPGYERPAWVDDEVVRPLEDQLAHARREGALGHDAGLEGLDGLTHEERRARWRREQAILPQCGRRFAAPGWTRARPPIQSRRGEPRRAGDRS